MHGLSLLKPLFVEDIGSHGGESRLEDAFLDLQALLGHHVPVFPVAQGNGDGHLARLFVQVDDNGGTVAALDDDLLAVVAIDDIFGLTHVAVAELVDGLHHGVLELVVAHLANLVVAPIVLAGATVRTAVEQRRAILAGGQEDPSQADELIAHAGRGVIVAIGVVRLDPGHQMGGIHRMMPRQQVVGTGIVLIEHVAQHPAIVAGCEVHILGIALLRHIAVLQHLTIDKKLLAWHSEPEALDGLAAHGHVPEVVLGRFGVTHLAWQADVLGRVVAESARATGQHVVDILHVVVLEIGILGVDVGQRAHLARRALVAVTVVLDGPQAVGMEQVLTAIHGTVQARVNLGAVDDRVVGKHIDDDAQAKSLGLVTHRLELIARAQLIVADGPIRRLVMVIPFAMAKELTPATLTHNTLVDGRSLHNRVARILDLGQVLADGVERPRPRVQNNLIITL